MNSQMFSAYEAAIRKIVPTISPVHSTGRGPSASSTRPETSDVAAPSRYEPIKAALTAADDQPSSSCIGPVMIPKPYSTSPYDPQVRMPR